MKSNSNCRKHNEDKLKEVEFAVPSTTLIFLQNLLVEIIRNIYLITT